MTTAGYSGTPLAKKLGIAGGGAGARDAPMRVVAVDAPSGYRASLEPLPATVTFVPDIDPEVAVVHLFTTKRATLERQLARCRETLASAAVVWVSWPKKASRVATEVDENVIRAVAFPLGFVDVKVCAVDAVWSGLKLVVRKHLR